MIHSHWHSKKHHEFPVAGPASIGGINSWSEPGRHIRNLKDQMKTSCHLLAYLWNTKQQTQCSAQTEIPIYITIYIPMISSSIFTNIHCLVGGDWNMNFMTFHSVGNNHPNWRTPSFFRGLGIPPTSIVFICVFLKQETSLGWRTTLQKTIS